MIKDKELIPILTAAEEGNMFMAGQLMKGLSDQDIAWLVIENHRGPNGQRRITLHGYWHDIFVVSKVVKLNTNTGKLTWGATKT